MKRIFHCILACVAIAMSCVSCTNGGDIGPLYGLWMFDSVSIDGHDDADIDLEQYAISFQDNTVRLTLTFGHNEFKTNMGFWSRENSELTLDFSSQGDDWFYFRPIGFTPGMMRMRIESESSRELRLRHVDAKGRTLRYILRKNL